MRRPVLPEDRKIGLVGAVAEARDPSPAWPSPRQTGAVLAALAAAMTLAPVGPGGQARAQDTTPSDSAAVFNSSKVCAQTTSIMYKSCGIQARADYDVAVATCNNDADEATRKSCLTQANDDFASAKDDCRGQTDARQSVCAKVGPGPYDPAIDPSNFTSSTKINNSFWPLPVGRVWVYYIINKGDSAPSQVDTVEVTSQTITLMGVKCLVVHDYQVDAKTKQLTEDTYDFYAQDNQGNVWYFGESSTTYTDGFIDGSEGSWRAGVDGAKPGILMQAATHAGQSYRQEFSPGTAEDGATVVSLGGSKTVPAGSYSDVLETNEYEGLDPEADENKFYAPGIGNILTIDNTTGEQDPLVSVKCDGAGGRPRRSVCPRARWAMADVTERATMRRARVPLGGRPQGQDDDPGSCAGKGADRGQHDIST